MLFEELGIIYLGPVDGGDIKGILKLLQEASRVDGPVLVHVITHKGTGYAPAERIRRGSTGRSRLILRQDFRSIRG